jgi:hypothetical protein
MSACVTQILDLDQTAREALLTISDASHSCEAYCQPCSVALGSSVELPLLALETSGCMRAQAESI